MEDDDRLRIEARAEQVLAEVPDWIWDGGSLPVPIEAIADSCFDLLVRDVELEEMQTAPDCPPLDEGSSLSGLFLPQVRQIWVNADEAREWPPRRRFTIGHELGHCVLHQDGQRSLFCRHGSSTRHESDTAASPTAASAPDPDEQAAIEIEREANHFAAALLMPGELIRHHYQRDWRRLRRPLPDLRIVAGSDGPPTAPGDQVEVALLRRRRPGGGRLEAGDRAQVLDRVADRVAGPEPGVAESVERRLRPGEDAAVERVGDQHVAAGAGDDVERVAPAADASRQGLGAGDADVVGREAELAAPVAAQGVRADLDDEAGARIARIPR